MALDHILHQLQIASYIRLSDPAVCTHRGPNPVMSHYNLMFQLGHARFQFDNFVSLVLSVSQVNMDIMIRQIELMSPSHDVIDSLNILTSFGCSLVMQVSHSFC